uniref:C-type lectin domain-containing protein n=1 Tax=Oryzias latipes TaxID=8090 RepID=A0A3P9L7R6_ORYLA
MGHIFVKTHVFLSETVFKLNDIFTLMYDYYFVNMNMSWTEAQQHCRTHYTDLATVTNRKDLDKLRNMQRSSMAAWIGLYYEAGTIETFHWSLPGLEFNKTKVNWNDNEPNGEKKETCVALCQNFKWVDLKCTQKSSFLCFNSKKVFISLCSNCTHFHTKKLNVTKTS